MTIEMLDRGTILVSMKNEELREYALDFSQADTAETGLKNLLLHVGAVCGLDQRGKSFLIEALPARSGCLLIISVHAVKRRRRYRIKRAEKTDVCIFCSADDMLDCLGGLSFGYSLYLYTGKYVLLPASSAPESAVQRLCEFGELHALSRTAAARIAEYGKLLRQVDVQRRHICGRAVTVRDTALRHAAC